MTVRIYRYIHTTALYFEIYFCENLNMHAAKLTAPLRGRNDERVHLTYFRDLSVVKLKHLPMHRLKIS